MDETNERDLAMIRDELAGRPRSYCPPLGAPVVRIASIRLVDGGGPQAGMPISASVFERRGYSVSQLSDDDVHRIYRAIYGHEDAVEEAAAAEREEERALWRAVGTASALTVGAILAVIAAPYLWQWVTR